MSPREQRPSAIISGIQIEKPSREHPCLIVVNAIKAHLAPYGLVRVLCQGFTLLEGMAMGTLPVHMSQIARDRVQQDGGVATSRGQEAARPKGQVPTEANQALQIRHVLSPSSGVEEAPGIEVFPTLRAGPKCEACLSAGADSNIALGKEHLSTAKATPSMVKGFCNAHLIG